MRTPIILSAAIAVATLAALPAEARINQRLEEERISNINVVQPPTLSSKANSPNGKTVFLLGGVLAVLSGVGLPFGWELGRRGGPLLLAALAAPPGGV